MIVMNIIELIGDPRIQRNIAPQKLLLLTQLSSQANIQSKEDIIPFFLNASSKAKSMGISFTEQETEVILSVITSHMNPAEQAKFETIKLLTRLLNERNTNNNNNMNYNNPQNDGK